MKEIKTVQEITGRDLSNDIIVIDGRKFYGIARLGMTQDSSGSSREGFVITLYSTDADEKGRRGTYSTVIPISYLEYRKKNPTKTKYIRKSVTELVVYDDWMHSCVIEAENDVINALQQQLDICQISKQSSLGERLGRNLSADKVRFKDFKCTGIEDIYMACDGKLSIQLNGYSTFTSVGRVIRNARSLDVYNEFGEYVGRLTAKKDILDYVVDILPEKAEIEESV